MGVTRRIIQDLEIEFGVKIEIKTGIIESGLDYGCADSYNFYYYYRVSLGTSLHV